MTAIQAIILGVVQGVTEFLPVSSSAHLILASKLLGWSDQGLHFDMAANTGSLLAVLVYLRRELAALARGLADGAAGRRTEEARGAAQVLVASVPVALAGVLLQGFVAGDGRSLAVLGTTSVLFGALLAWADRLAPAATETGDGAEREAAAWSWRQTLAVGLAQALALIPGTSRSGVTMTAGLFAGMSRPRATRLSFLLAVPVGLMVAFKDGWDLVRHPAATQGFTALALGTLAAAVSAYVAIDWLLKWVRRHGFMGFAIYRIVLGLGLLALAAG